MESQSEKQDRRDDTWSEIIRKAGVPNDQKLTVADVDTACRRLHLYLFGHEWNQADYPSPIALARHPHVAQTTLKMLLGRKEKLRRELLALDSDLSKAIKSYKQIDFWPVPQRQREEARQRYDSIGLLSIEEEIRVLESMQMLLSRCLSDISIWDKKVVEAEGSKTEGSKTKTSETKVVKVKASKTKGSKPLHVNEVPSWCTGHARELNDDGLPCRLQYLCPPSVLRCEAVPPPAKPAMGCTVEDAAFCKRIETLATRLHLVVNQGFLDPISVLLNINRHSDLVELGLSKTPGPYSKKNPWVALPLPKGRLATFMAHVTVERDMAGQARLSDKEFVVIAILSKAWVMTKRFLADLPGLPIEDVLMRAQGAVVKARKRLLERRASRGGEGSRHHSASCVAQCGPRTALSVTTPTAGQAT